MRVSSPVDPIESLSRRDFLCSFSALAMAQILVSKDAAPRGGYGIAVTSFPIRMRQARQAMSGEGPGIPAEKFIDLCKSFGGDGCQMSFSQLTSTDSEYLKSIRGSLEQKSMFMEFAVSSRLLEDADLFANTASVASQLGVSRLRVALLSGRRYEDFDEMQRWQSFANHWKNTLKQAEPLLKKHQLLVGIENHKDWRADELVEILRAVSSPYLGACVDFGNNLALLEDPLETAQKLAPYAVTSHLKDMAVAPYDLGFLLSEVPLGEGILPLAKMMEILRGGRKDIHFCLEMITRDPLKVPYKEDKYWVTYEKREAARIEKFEKTILSQASGKPLPKISIMSTARMLATEDDNLRRCTAYAKRTLGL